MTESPTPSRLRSRLLLLLIVALFFGSFGIAALLRFSGWMPAHMKNYGQMLEPPVDLSTVVLVLESDAHWIWQNDQDRWTALVRVPADCDTTCWDQVAVLPRVRLSLGRNSPRLDLLLLDADLPADRERDLADLRLAASATPLPAPLPDRVVGGPEVWLVDPHGYAILRYGPGYDARGLRQDLAKLIR